MCHLDSFYTILVNHTNSDLTVEIPMDAVYMGSPESYDTLLKMWETDRTTALELFAYYYIPSAPVPEFLKAHNASPKPISSVLKEAGLLEKSFTFQIHLDDEVQRTLGAGPKVVRVNLTTPSLNL